ncbi:MAG: hypothetical protein KC731_36345 [Myxococcales bacterium]|nr:hypothetical protein [Myxococcales bacterium]MCA9630441.1 hypothetical protein [Myxococcales bacterium]
MSAHLYIAIEGRPRIPSGRWRFMQRMPSPGSTREVHGVLGIGDDDSDVSCLELRGLPPDVADETLGEDAFFIDDAMAESSASDCVDSRFCTAAQARAWEASGASRILSAERVTSPDAFGQSWATAAELERVLPPKARDSAIVDELRRLVETMRRLEELDVEVRAIYWFE